MFFPLIPSPPSYISLLLTQALDVLNVIMHVKGVLSLSISDRTIMSNVSV